MEPWSWPQHILLSLFHHYSICIGMNSTLYDQRTHTFQQTRFTRWLALLLNALTLVLLPLVIWDALHLMDGFEVSLLVLASNYGNMLVRALVVLYTVVMRSSRERQVCRNGITMLQLDREYFMHLPQNAAIDRRFSRLFYVKYLFMLWMMLLALLSLFSSKRHWQWYSYVLMFLYAHIMNVVHVTVFTYFIILWYVCRHYCYINVQLSSLLAELQQKEAQQQEPPNQQETTSSHTKLQRMLRAHWQLGEMIERLNSTYHFQMLATRFTFIVANVIMGYLGVVFSFDYDTPGLLILAGALSYVAMSLDLYLVDMMCDMTVKERNATAKLLSSFTELQQAADGAMAKEVEQFALQMSSTELRVDIAGLFVVDKSLWFAMSASIISYTIVLVQFHIVWNKKGNRRVLVN